MPSETVERTILINAPRAKVWRAITDPTEIAQWFIPTVPGAEITRSDTGTLMMHIGEMGVDFALLDIVEDGRSVTILTLPDRRLPATYTLSEESGGTRLTVSISGFDSLHDDETAVRQRITGEGWDKTLGNLQAYVQGSELPNPGATVGPLFGYWTRVRKRHAIERSIWIDAGREKVWRAITDPKQIQAWLSPATERRLTALEVGGRYFVPDAETGAEKHVEIIEKLEPPSMLLTRALPEPGMYQEALQRFTLIEEDGGTRVTILYIDAAPEWTDEIHTMMEQSSFGFGMMLDNLKAFVDGRDLPYPWGF
jgi:uncharacterized protein YndB with AHSA1/START domain